MEKILSVVKRHIKKHINTFMKN